jgi:ubiquinone/menaquinone biosynthesis C-methylase UbiE
MNAQRDSVESVFDKRAATYDRNSWHVRYAERLVELAAPAPGMRVLDAGTGTGFGAIAAARAVGPTGRVVGVDISRGMLDRARRSIVVARLSNLTLVQADATSLACFPDASFDLVLCSAGLLYMPVQAALGEWRRLLAPDGLAGFSTMREGFPIAARLFRERARRYGLSLSDPAAPLGTASRCSKALRDAGLTPRAPALETIQFSRDDLEHAWEAHAHGTYHAAVATLADEQVRAFQHDYTSALAGRMEADGDRLLSPEVIYAFGHRPAPRTRRG